MPDIKVRYGWVDWSKFICITLMILCHTGMWGSGYKEWIAQVIYSFHMPAFFIISGFLYKPRSWWKTIIFFSLPILFFSVIKFAELVCLQYFLSKSINLSEIIDFDTYWCNSTGHKTLFTGQWFLFALIGCRFMMGDIAAFKIFGKFYWAVGLVALIYVSVDYYFAGDYFFKRTYLYNSVVAMVFFSFGMFLKKIKIDFSKYSIGVVIVATAIALLMSFINGRIDMNLFNYGSDIILFYVNAFIASICLFMWTSRCKQNSVVQSFSVGTLALLGSHMTLHKIILPCLHVLGLHEGGLIAIVSTFIILLLNYPLILFALKKASWMIGK